MYMLLGTMNRRCGRIWRVTRPVGETWRQVIACCGQSRRDSFERRHVIEVRRAGEGARQSAAPPPRMPGPAVEDIGAVIGEKRQDVSRGDSGWIVILAHRALRADWLVVEDEFGKPSATFHIVPRGILPGSLNRPPGTFLPKSALVMPMSQRRSRRQRRSRIRRPRQDR